MATDQNNAPKGFEFSPLGHLLDQVIDLSRPMGVAYERSVDFYKDFHTHDRLMLVFPRGSCTMLVATAEPGHKYQIDQTSFLIVPANRVHDDLGTSAIYDTVALYPSKELVDKIAVKENYTPTQILDFINLWRRQERSPRLEMMLQEYFFERIVSKRVDGEIIAAFEYCILSEVVASVLGRSRSVADGTFTPLNNELFARAIRHIETNLFSNLTLSNIAKAIHSSPSTLIRVFKNELRQTPTMFIRNRRLDEAMMLLNRGGYQVGEISSLVGYSDFSAFTQAFKAKFGKPPSAFLKVKV